MLKKFFCKEAFAIFFMLQQMSNLESLASAIVLAQILISSRTLEKQIHQVNWVPGEDSVLTVY